MREAAARVKEAAHRIGFDAVGIARADRSEDADRFREWIARRFHGEMAWMERDPERREDPRVYMPGAKSVVCVAQSYFAEETPPPPSGRGEVSNYARGEDYHVVLKDRLRDLVREIEGFGCRARACVDTSAVLEKSWAQRAGVGWRGKNTLLIREGIGSYVFLGEVVTDLDLEPDEAASDQCGSCVRCISACPTGAIVAPYVLDSRRCISYLTIEHRGAIPTELRPAIGNRVFGCDDCQTVCPWNRHARPTAESRYLPREGSVAPLLEELLSLTDQQFRSRFGDTAISRTKREGLARNAAIALGNAGDRAGVPALARALAVDPSPIVRGHAAWALGRLGGAEARSALDGSLSLEPDAWARSEIESALGTLSE
ncbi:MAG: tRNA epoxyqueuosine(34) reductase QueG [Planctomycetota bacterium]